MAAPVPFIAVDPRTNKLAVTAEARDILAQMHGTVSVCAVAGVYRTGKSYILNQLAGKHSGFGIGSSVQACTKGIWLWGAPVAAGGGMRDDVAKHMILLDTEGLQSISQSEGHDAKIFCLAILLSSFFIYNSEKAVNNAAIDQLSLVAQLTKKIRAHAEGGGDEAAATLAQFFPRFVWLLRDFQLELQDEDGRDISIDEYLEECLQPKRGSSAAIAEQNQTRESIRKLFPHRSCIALPHPTLGTNLPSSALKKLPELSQLATGFRDGVTQLKRLMLSSAQPKQLNGTPLTGVTLLGLAEAYTKAINEGAVPTISTAWQSVLHIECGKALEAAVKLYRDGAHEAACRDPPLDTAAWQGEHEALLRNALARFREIAVGDNTHEYEAKLIESIEDAAKQQRQLLDSRSKALCQTVLSALSDEMEAYKRSTEPDAHVEALPRLVQHVFKAFETQAAGTAREEARNALNSKLQMLLTDVLNSMKSAANAQVMKLKQELQQMQQSLAASNERVSEAAKEEQKLRTTITSLEHTNSQLTAQMTSLNSAKDAAETVLRAERDDALRQRDHTKQELAAANLAVKDVEKKLGQAEITAARQAAQAETSQSKVESEAKAARLLFERQEKDLLAKQTELSNTCEQLRMQLTSNQSQFDIEKSSLQQAITQLQAGLDGKKSTLQETIDKLRTDLSSITIAKDAVVLEATRAKTDLDAANKRNATLEDAAARSAKDLEEANKRNEDLEKQLATLQANAQGSLAAAAASDRDHVGSKRPRVSEAAMDEENDNSYAMAMMDDMDQPPAQETGSRRHSIDPKLYALPKLQTMLRQKLGQKAKLPKKKDELLALCNEHGLL